MAALPAVRVLSAELESVNVDSLLVNIHEEPGLTLRERFSFEYSPTFLLLAADGGEVLRSNTTPSLADIQAALE